MFPMEVAGTQLFVAVPVFGTLVPLVRNMKYAEQSSQAESRVGKLEGRLAMLDMGSIAAQ